MVLVSYPNMPSLRYLVREVIVKNFTREIAEYVYAHYHEFQRDFKFTESFAANNIWEYYKSDCPNEQVPNKLSKDHKCPYCGRWCKIKNSWFRNDPDPFPKNEAISFYCKFVSDDYRNKYHLEIIMEYNDFSYIKEKVHIVRIKLSWPSKVTKSIGNSDWSFIYPSDEISKVKDENWKLVEEIIVDK